MKNKYNKIKTLQSIGKVIRAKRKRAGMSQTELAVDLGVTKSTICKYENGSIDMPASVLPAISDSCNFKLSDYIDTTEKANKATNIIMGNYTNQFNEFNEFNDESLCVKESDTEYNISKDIETIKDYFIEYEDTADLVISLEESVNSENDTIKNAAKTLIIESISPSDNKFKERIGMYLKHLNKL